MDSAKRGVLAAFGLVVGFLTLVFVSQMFRYMTPALYGDQLSLGMWGIYVVLTYVGGAISIWSFVPRVSVGKALGGLGLGVGGLLAILGVYLFATSAFASGLMTLIFAVVTGAAGVIVYLFANSRAGGSDTDGTPDSALSSEPAPGREVESEPVTQEPEPEPVTTHVEPENTAEPASEPRENTGTDVEPEPESGRDIDWKRGAQVFGGVVVVLIGIPITIQSPVGVPIVVLGLALIPRVREWGMNTLGRSSTGG